MKSTDSFPTIGLQEIRAIEEMTNWTQMTDADMQLIAEPLLSQ